MKIKVCGSICTFLVILRRALEIGAQVIKPTSHCKKFLKLYVKLDLTRKFQLGAIVGFQETGLFRRKIFGDRDKNLWLKTLSPYK